MLHALPVDVIRLNDLDMLIIIDVDALLLRQEGVTS